MTSHDKIAILHISEDIKEACGLLATKQLNEGQYLTSLQHAVRRITNIIHQQQAQSGVNVIAKPSYTWKDYCSDTKCVEFALKWKLPLPRGNYRKWFATHEDYQGLGHLTGIEKNGRKVITGWSRITDGVLSYIEREDGKQPILVHKDNWILHEDPKQKNKVKKETPEERTKRITAEYTGLGL